MRPSLLNAPTTALLAATLIGLPATVCRAQSFNVDLEVTIAFGTPTGLGAPSAGFGGAAGQAGFWNTANSTLLTPIPLMSLGNTATAASLQMSTNAPNGFAHWNLTNVSNTGDWARLLNDSHIVNNSPGPWSNTYAFTGLQPGTYDVITYGVRPMTGPSATRVAVTGGGGTQTVVGPMPGNSFGLLVTHSWHTVNVTGSSLTVTVDRDAGLSSAGAYINGFQLIHTPVPAPGAGAVLAVAGMLGSGRRRR